MNYQHSLSVQSELIQRLKYETEEVGLNEKTWAIFSDQAKIDSLASKLSKDLDQLICQALLNLNNPKCGLIAIDIPEIESVDIAENMWLGSLFAIIISKLIYNIRMDPHTGLPFTIYNASNQGERLLKKMESNTTLPIKY